MRKRKPSGGRGVKESQVKPSSATLVLGRPSSYSDATANAICESVACGDSMREAARKQGLSESTIREWRKSNDAFSAQYAHAVTARAEVFFERGNDIAMGITTAEEAQVARVQLDWLKWSASKLGPKTYGEKLSVDGNLEISLAERISKARRRNDDDSGE